MKPKPNFQFYNQVSPTYIEPIFLQMETSRWYTSTELKLSLQRSNSRIEGSDIVAANIKTWSLAGLGETRLIQDGRSKVLLFCITDVGKQILETYSTNRELFFDIMHFMFYSTWFRSLDPYRGRFWVYARVCDDLWKTAPSKADSFALAAKLQNESIIEFSEYQPSFSERSMGAIFKWLNVLTPSFLEKCGGASMSRRRNYCTPQLFHLATDLVYTCKALKYGTSIAVNDEVIEFICRTCLLDPNQFWEIADRTKLSVRGFEIRKGQWGTSLALNEPPAWIKLPDFQGLAVNDSNEEGDEE